MLHNLATVAFVWALITFEHRSLENFGQGKNQLSFFRYSLVLIPKRKYLVGASLIRCRKTGTPSTFPLTRSGSGVVTSADRIWGYSVFMLCFHYGGADAGRKRVSTAGPQEWVLEPFFRSALQSGSGFETIGFKSLEVSKPRYWY